MATPAQQINQPTPRIRNASPRVPFFVPLFNPIARRLLRVGVPLGPNALLTVRGRTSGVDRTTPVAVVAIGGRRWLIGTFGEVNWVRNLRAAHEATLTINRRPEPVQAVELSQQEASSFFKDVLTPYVSQLPLGRFLLGTLGAKELLTDPDAAAQHHPVFELHPRDYGVGSGTSTTT
jgi:deazaflavin-dependent oxidoreductase (nitroreductase family)